MVGHPLLSLFWGCVERGMREKMYEGLGAFEHVNFMEPIKAAKPIKDSEAASHELTGSLNPGSC